MPSELYALLRYHLVDEDGNSVDITRLMPLLRRLGIAREDDWSPGGLPGGGA